METIVATQLVVGALRLGAALHRAGNRLVRPEGLNQQQVVVLDEIVRRGPLHHKDIAGELLLLKANVSKIVRALVEAKLVRVRPSPDDGRARLVAATGRGRATWKRCLASFDTFNLKLAKALSPQQASRTIAAQRLLLQRLYQFETEEKQ